MKIDKLTQSKNVPDRWYVDVAGETLRVDTGAVAELSLFTGRELNDSELDLLRRRAALTGARERALRLLESRQLSRRELIRKLTEKGETPEAAEAAADLMERIGALNDREYAGAVGRMCARKGFGPSRLREELYKRGVPKEYWEEAAAELPEDNSETIDSVIQKRLRDPGDEKEVRRVIAYLQRRGFAWSEIKEGIDKMSN